MRRESSPGVVAKVVAKGTLTAETVGWNWPVSTKPDHAERGLKEGIEKPPHQPEQQQVHGHGEHEQGGVLRGAGDGRLIVHGGLLVVGRAGDDAHDAEQPPDVFWPDLDGGVVVVGLAQPDEAGGQG